MPHIVDLLSKSKRLRNVNLIVGEWLCSYIYVIDKKQAVIVDTARGEFSRILNLARS